MTHDLEIKDQITITLCINLDYMKEHLKFDSMHIINFQRLISSFLPQMKEHHQLDDIHVSKKDSIIYLYFLHRNPDLTYHVLKKNIKEYIAEIQQNKIDVNQNWYDAKNKNKM